MAPHRLVLCTLLAWVATSCSSPAARPDPEPPDLAPEKFDTAAPAPPEPPPPPPEPAPASPESPAPPAPPAGPETPPPPPRTPSPAVTPLPAGLANPANFVYDDGVHTVQGYLFQALQAETDCCGDDAVYLQIDLDDRGRATGVQALTGKNDCYRRSMVDLLRRVVWSAESGKRKVYIEAKPTIPCAGGPSDNRYRPLAY